MTPLVRSRSVSGERFTRGLYNALRAIGLARLPSVRVSESSSETRLRAADDVIFRELAGEAVILDLKSGLYYGLDEIGTRFWTLLMDGGDVGTAVAALLAEYDVDEERLRADVDRLLSDLVSKKLVTTSPH